MRYFMWSATVALVVLSAWCWHLHGVIVQLRQNQARQVEAYNGLARIVSQLQDERARRMVVPSPGREQ